MDRIQILAQSLNLGHAQLLGMAREAAHNSALPSVEHLTALQRDILIHELTELIELPPLLRELANV